MLSPAHFSAAESILGTFQNSQIGKVIPGKTFVQIWPEASSILGHSRISEMFYVPKVFDPLVQSNNASESSTFPCCRGVIGKTYS